ncbi:M16 family metallopeptidase [Thiomicrorhabdus arctica]|uniref:M16 family metallopeptidase n=1 Tax=Thiomicrorhabdus arctica TaxID=131540 RepID=UPI0003706C84|nr:pitrilysin family protein [Thiomicrorhabdus arctica]
MHFFYKHIITSTLMSLAFSLFSLNAWSAVQIEQWHTKQGAKVMYVHAPQLPMLDIQVSFDAGSARDGQQWGLASMMTTLLGLQTKTHSEEELSDLINALGANVGGSIDRDMASYTLRTLTRESILKPALDLFHDSIVESTFDESIFERERNRVLVGLKQQQLMPSSIASNAFWAMLYGNHPYAHPVAGNVESVKALKLDAIQAFYNQYIVSKNALISIVGNVDKHQAQQIAENLLKGLPVGKVPAILEAPSSDKKGLSESQRHKVIEFDSTQTYFKQGQIGVKRGDPDYYALFLGNHLLGGSGFGSLLMEEVREKRGLVYGVSSGFAPMRQPGPWLVGLSTKNKSAMQAKKVVNQTIKAFMKGFDEKHLQAIKDNLVGGFPLRIDSNGKIIGYITMIGFYDLPLNYLEEFPKAISALSKQDVLDAWQRHMDLKSMKSIMVGKPE